MPHSHEVMTNISTAVKNSRTSPKRRATQPVSGTEMALATANEVITHVPCDVAAPKSPAMCGRATLAMVVSNTSMNTANDSAMVSNTKGRPLKYLGCDDINIFQNRWITRAGCF